MVNDMNPELPNRITMMLDKLYDMYDAYFRGHYPSSTVPTFSAEYGPKNVRIVISDRSSRSVYCFVDIESGDILKSASWKAPAKGKRGSIWNDECDVGYYRPCNIYGSNLYKKR